MKSQTQFNATHTSARMRAENTHKLMGIYMEVLILGVILCVYLRVLTRHPAHVLGIQFHRIVPQLGFGRGFEVLATYGQVAVPLHPPGGGRGYSHMSTSKHIHVHLFHVAIETKTSKPNNSASTDQLMT